MSKNLVDALNGGAWSVSAVIFDLNDMLDDEGRPISERRANAAVRAGVEMDMRECPYAGIRHGRLMNTSALAQVSHHYNPVMGEIAAFRRQTAGKDATWSDILAAILDPLARPAVHLLQQRNARGPVPAQVAVGHKLAAGFFGVMRTLHERLALGADLPVSTEAFLDLVEETGALVGPAEACAGSPQMLRKASTILVEGGTANETTLDQARLDMARCLGQQVQLGIFWQLYDRRHVWELIRGQRLVPCNIFLMRKLERAMEEASPSAPPRPDRTVRACRQPSMRMCDTGFRMRCGMPLTRRCCKKIDKQPNCFWTRLAQCHTLRGRGCALCPAGCALPPCAPPVCSRSLQPGAQVAGAVGISR